MAKRKSSEKTSNREKNWEQVFNALVKMSHNLHNERETLEEKIKSLQGLMHQMKMEQRMQSAKAELIMSLKETEAFMYKHKYENADSELMDFRQWFIYLSQKCAELKDLQDNYRDKTEGKKYDALQSELRRIRSEMEKCKSEKNTEVAALVAEKNFVWNQYKKLESDFTERLRKKHDEVEYANQQVWKLVSRTEELQSSNDKLRTDFANLESESSRKSEEISRLLKEIGLLKSGSGSSTPALRRCRGESQTSRNNSRDGRAVTVKKESNLSQAREKMEYSKPTAHKSTGGKAPKKKLAFKGSSSSNRNADNVITIPDTPKLFTSSFKVPKLKS